MFTGSMHSAGLFFKLKPRCQLSQLEFDIQKRATNSTITASVNKWCTVYALLVYLTISASMQQTFGVGASKRHTCLPIRASETSLRIQ